MKLKNNLFLMSFLKTNKTFIIKLLATIFLACCFYVPAMFIIGLALFAGIITEPSGVWSGYFHTTIAIFISFYLGFTIANKYKPKK